jgi:hypothetical protein
VCYNLRMKFFLPHSLGAESERIYQQIKFQLKTDCQYPVTDRRIFQIRYLNRQGDEYGYKVGTLCGTNGEEVIAIFESFVYLICTNNRGVRRGTMPLVVGKNETKMVEEFGTETVSPTPQAPGSGSLVIGQKGNLHGAGGPLIIG